jgi:hypothetical protein
MSFLAPTSGMLAVLRTMSRHKARARCRCINCTTVSGRRAVCMVSRAHVRGLGRRESFLVLAAGTEAWTRPSRIFAAWRGRDVWARRAGRAPVLYVYRSPCLRAADPNRDSNHDSNHNHNHGHNYSHNHARTCRVAPSQDASFPPWTRASRACTRCRLCCVKTCT